MERNILAILLIFSLFVACTGNKEQGTNEQQQPGEQQQPTAVGLEKGTIQHTVQFNLKWDADAPETIKFLQDGKRILSALPTVQNFEALRQISVKNNYRYYFTMVFENKEAYDAYNNHPDHVAFVNERWQTEVTDFLEADFVTLE